MTVISISKKPALFTVWDDLANNEGATLQHHLYEHPVILAKRLSVTKFRGGMLFTSVSETLLFYLYASLPIFN